MAKPALAADLLDLTDSLSNYSAGATADHTITFITVTDMPKNGKILIDFPEGFDISGASLGSLMVGGEIATFSLATSGQRATLNKTGNNAVVADTPISIQLKGIVNAQNAGTYYLAVTTTGPNGTTALDGPTNSSDFTITTAGVSTLQVSGYPSPVSTGESHSFTVSALDEFNNVAVNYSGTVHFTSTDPLAELPSDYTFVTSDAGTHSFSAVFATAGTQSITATDTVSSNITGTQAGIAVSPVFNIVTESPLPEGTAGLDYGPVTLNATGGVLPYSWSVQNGALPDGLSLSSNGLISGTPSLAGGPITCTIQVTDNATSPDSALKDFSITINKAPTSTGVQSSNSSSEFGQTVTFTASVTSSAGVPTGTVTFADGGNSLGTGTLNGSGQATFATASLATGNHSITATYDGDTNFAGSTSTPIAQSVGLASTRTSVTSSNYSSTYGQSVTFTASVSATPPASGTPTGTVAFKDGTTLLGTATLNSSGQASYSTTALAAVVHTINAVYQGDANFATSSGSLTQTVGAASVTPAVTVANKTYDGNNSATINSRTLTGVIGGDDVSLTGGTATFATADAGTGITVNVTGLSLTGTSAANYVLSSTSASTTANISPKSLTVSGISASSKVYDGTAAATIDASQASLVGVIPGDVVTLDISQATGTFADKNAGTNKPVTLSGLKLEGTDALNYTIDPTAATQASITPLLITGSISVQNKVYDGTTAATIASRSLSGVIAGDTVSYTGGSATFASSGAGTVIPVNVTGLSLSGTNAPNYTVNSTATTSADITPRPLTVTADPQSKVYGDPDPPLTWQITSGSLAGSDALSGVLTRDPGEAVGTYPIRQGTLTAGLNYNLSYTGANLVIAANSAVVTLGNLNQTYDGTPKSASVTTSPAGLSYSITYNGVSTAPTQAGSYTVKAIVTDPNYAGSATDTLLINKATPSINWANPADIVYPTPLGSGQLNATASVPGQFSYSPPVGTVLSPGNNQNLHVDFTPTDSLDYNSASRDVKINVLAAGSIDHYYVSIISSPQTSGAAFSVTIQAQDQYGNNISSGGETVNITFGQPDVDASPVSAVTVNGAATVSLTLKATQTAQTVIFTGATSGKQGTSNNFAVQAASGGGGGGGGLGGLGGGTSGGGGGSTSERMYLSQFMTGSPGVFSQDVALKAYDGICNLLIPKNTDAKTAEGWALSYITFDPVPADKQTLPPPPEGNIIGLTYSLGPEGTTFDPPVTMYILYFPDKLPAGVKDSDLVIGFWDAANQQWVPLSGSQVDTTRHTVTAAITHFSIYTILYVPGQEPPAPSLPDLTLSNLTVDPAEATVGQKITISARVTNNTDSAANYVANLELNDQLKDSQTLSVQGNASQTVSFTTAIDVPGNYSVKINELSGQVTVDAPAAPAATPASQSPEQPEPAVPPVVMPPLSPAIFTLSGLKLSPAQVSSGQEVDASVLVTNSGESTGDYTLTLKINGNVSDTRQVTVPGQSNQTVDFKVSQIQSGRYLIEINGLTEVLQVSSSLPGWLIPAGIILIVFVFGGTLWFVLRRSGRSGFQLS